MKKYWDIKKKENVLDRKTDLFISDIIEVYRKHNLSISHEDSHGCFIVEDYKGEKDFNAKWLSNAHIDYTKEEEML